jgi:uncharacterized protein Yka (UPF0111/DUF47 family)
LPADSPDITDLLVDQGQQTVDAAEAFDQWANGDASQAQRVRSLEHAADDARRAVVTALRRTFTTPVEPEDLFELSERLDAVLNQMKDLVREAEVLAVVPDRAMVDMSRCVLTGVRELVAALPNLARSPDAATAAADRAIRHHRRIERVYRQAMSALVRSADMREAAAKRELYRRYARIGDAIEHVANRIWYAVVKRE